MEAESLASLRAALKRESREGEVISAVDPRGLDGGRWWSGAWPERLTAGVLEPRRGFRFRPENLVLARMLEGLRAERVVELGCGSGSMMLMAACLLRPAPASVVGLERQAEVVERLERTLSAHALPNLSVVRGDLRDAGALERAREVLGGAAELAIFNPPYFPKGWGRPSAHDSTHASTHALHGDVGAFLEATCALGARRALVVFDAQRLSPLLASAGTAGFGLERALFIPDQRPERADAPTRVWVSLRRSDGAALESL